MSYRERIRLYVVSLILAVAAVLPALRSSAASAAAPAVHLVSAVQATPSDAGFELPVVQLHNWSTQPVSLEALRLQMLTNGQAVDLLALHGTLQAGGDAVYGPAGALDGADGYYASSPAFDLNENEIRLSDAHQAVIDQLHWQSGSEHFGAGDWLSADASGVNSWQTSVFTPHSGGLSETDVSTDASKVQINELLPYAQTCVADTACPDYIELYNPTDASIDLSGYYLRTSYGGLSAKASRANAIVLDSVVLAPHQYYVADTLNYDPDKLGDLALTNSGGSVWLERIDSGALAGSVVTYPDANSHRGQTWALNAQGTWQWTTQPTPGQANIFPVSASQSAPSVAAVAASSLAKSSATTYVACKVGQERNPTTHRCRNIAQTSGTLTNCIAGQIRNSATNRCRSASLTAAGLTACAVGKVRNPGTNRCKSATATTAKALTPCKTGQERNPATNRCHKSPALAAGSLAKVQDVRTAGSTSHIQWLLIALAGSGLLAYGVYEWRQEITTWFRRRFTSRPNGRLARLIGRFKRKNRSAKTSQPELPL